LFCPNCGAENKDTTAPCIRCGFKLSGVNASKFKGTIMLNSDETVQELIEAQRRKLAENAAAEPAPVPAPTPAAPTDPNAAPGADAAGGVPRPRRKLGGATILGVAPQMGGFKTEPPGGTLESPQHSPPAGAASGAQAATTPSPEAWGGSAPPADATAATEAMQAFTPAAGLGATSIGGTAPQPVRAEPAPARGTQPLQQSAGPGGSPFQTQASPRAALESAAPNKTVPLEQFPEPPAPGLGNSTGPLPAHTRAAIDAEASRVSSLPPIKKGISAGELFLVIATCGLYGVVRMLRQRKQP
jgi:zinc ribbon protein